MINEAPQNMETSRVVAINESTANKNTIEDSTPVKDSHIYKFQKWEYLVKKQTIGGKENLLMWFDELADLGWEIISQRANLGFYIFKKSLK